MNANINNVSTTGASAQTARQDRLGVSGVAASHAMAKTDAGRMARYKNIIKATGQKHGVDPALIAGIISRESRAGNVLQNGWGDHGNAWGLMQVDVNPHGGGHRAVGAWDSEEHLSQATGILTHFIQRIEKKFPQCTKEQQLKGGIAAYNAGDGRVHSCENVDANTTGKDYANDVVARAQWYKQQGY
ncbi:Lysozyme g [Oryzias melastigma]|uniref:Lysozyme g n=1 Tax=Oryzias melastigma TaxID=30732 RepID=A0A3B3DE77_ORYME|nr:lysozyme g [Oryzias melastigma]KAF6730280.1 Lysozyme g [Oryzias melastigma]